ncbi:hypothetical protein [Halosolutus gelatinilyticus]|uniref:hypothetical protein n=1 Tax=Halosolutus gelatinilyticus TaxID=2931975 RepID=UPI001FF47D99|nr:hypothetical protein [Halosolutus gelatinilyticus]
MATTDSYSSVQPKTSRDRSTRRRLREACTTILEAACRPTSFEPAGRVDPDGYFFRSEDHLFRKTWTRQVADGEERVQLRTDGPTSTWELVYQGPDGRSTPIETDLERDKAYTEAEQYMAELDQVPIFCRTGRAVM